MKVNDLRRKMRLGVLLATILCLFCGLANAAQVARVERNGLAGVIDADGSEVLPLTYEKLALLPNGTIAALKQGRCGVYDDKGKELLPFEYDQLFVCTDGTFLLQATSGKWCAADAKGQMLLPAEYGEIYDGSDGAFCVCNEDGSWQLVAAGGKPLSDNRYELLGNFDEGLAAAQSKGKLGFVNTKGGWIVPPIYDKVNRFAESRAAVCKGSKWGFVDNTGQTVIPIRYDGVLTPFSEGLAAVQDGGKISVIDPQGREVFRCKYKAIFAFKNGVAEVRTVKKKLNVLKALFYGASIGLGQYSLPSSNLMDKNERRGYIDRTGKEIVSPKMTAVSLCQDGMIVAEKKGKFGAFDAMGNLRVPFEYDALQDFADGYAAAKVGDVWRIIDHDNKTIGTFPVSVTNVGVFGGGLFPVCEKGLWGYMTPDAHMAIEPKYTRAESFASTNTGQLSE